MKAIIKKLCARQFYADGDLVLSSSQKADRISEAAEEKKGTKESSLCHGTSLWLIYHSKAGKGTGGNEKDSKRCRTFSVCKHLNRLRRFSWEGIS